MIIREGIYEIEENGIRFEAGVYSGPGRHVVFKALVGSCAGRESVHEYDWSLKSRKLTFWTDAGHVCIGRLILFTEYAFTQT